MKPTELNLVHWHSRLTFSATATWTNNEVSIQWPDWMTGMHGGTATRVGFVTTLLKQNWTKGNWNRIRHSHTSTVNSFTVEQLQYQCNSNTAGDSYCAGVLFSQMVMAVPVYGLCTDLIVTLTEPPRDKDQQTLSPMAQWKRVLENLPSDNQHNVFSLLLLSLVTFL